MKALVGAFNQEKALVEAFSVIVKLREGSFEALLWVPGQSRLKLSNLSPVSCLTILMSLFFSDKLKGRNAENII